MDIRVAISVLLGAGAVGQITYVSGVQDSSGWVRHIFEGDVQEASYDLAAPDPRTSWSPPGQAISVGGPPHYGAASVSTTYTSTLGAGEVHWFSQLLDAGAFPIGSGPNDEAFRYNRTLDLTFHLDVPVLADVAGHLLQRNLGGWGSGPYALSFGRIGDAPVFSFAGSLNSTSSESTFPTTRLLLAPGDYRVYGVGHGEWSSGNRTPNEVQDALQLDLVVVPSPGGVGVVAMGGVMVGGMGRRRGAPPACVMPVPIIERSW